MGLFVRLALRNCFRHRGRTAVALLAIASGAAALIVNGGVIYNIFRELREDAIRGRHGHMQIAHAGYAEEHLREPGRHLLSAADAGRILELLRGVPGIERVTRVREFSGLVVAGDRYVPFVGLGVEPEHDSELSRHVTLRRGEPLSAEDPYGMICGLGLADKFAGKPGDIVTLLTHGETGALNAVDARLRGVFEGGMKEFDDWTLKLPLAAAHELLLDERTERLVVLLERTEDVPRVAAEVKALLGREALDVEIRTWQELALFHNQVVDLFGRELDVIKIIVATIVILGIANTIGMSILERRAELATLRALGVGRGSIAALLFLEAAMLGLTGGLLGIGAGAGIARIVTAIGIPFPSPPGSTRPFQGGVDFVPEVVVFAFALSLVAALAAAALPIARVLRRRISDELR